MNRNSWRSFSVVPALVMAIAGVGRAHAVPTVILSSPDVLTHLAVGDQVRIDVTLSSLAALEFVFALNTRAVFSSSLFQSVPDPGGSSGLSAGPILSFASQRNNFNALSTFMGGSAVGNFSEITPGPAAAIGQNGIYYSFVLRANAPGNGLIQFDPQGSTYVGTDTLNSVASLPTSAPLAFSISAVPEPSSLLMLGFGTLGALGWARRRRVAVHWIARVDDARSLRLALSVEIKHQPRVLFGAVSRL